jgi:CheY-like chemotaxis protein
MNAGRTILIIEDDPFQLLTLTAYLEDSGFTCLQASDGKAGLEAFAAHRPDVVVTDLRMPGLDGLEVVASLLREVPGFPVIVLSGASDPATAKQALDLGARLCLSKPITDLAVLENALRDMLPQQVPIDLSGLSSTDAGRDACPRTGCDTSTSPQEH